MHAAKMICDSLAPCGQRLVTLQLTYERYIHDEFLTHRRISRNSRSSRAVPVSRMLQEVQDNPVIPLHWGINQAGMQASGELPPEQVPQARARWLEGRDRALQTARALHEMGLHKQVINYVLMPYTWITVVASATHWTNFFALRVNPKAHPSMQRLAALALEAYSLSVPEPLSAGELHLPYVQAQEKQDFYGVPATLKAISVARCARVSVRTFDSNTIDVAADLRLYNDLSQGGRTPDPDDIAHMSPFEHVATALAEATWSGNFCGFHQHRKEMPREEITTLEAAYRHAPGILGRELGAPITAIPGSGDG